MIIIYDYLPMAITAVLFAAQKANTQKIIDAIANCDNEISIDDLDLEEDT